MNIEINELIPDFSLEAYFENQFKRIKLSDYRGKWLILFFYPADFTFVCPTELSELADNYEALQGLNAEVLSVSTDTAFVHKAWHDNSPAINKIKFPMLADPTGSLAKSFGVYINEEGLARRATFIIDPDGFLKTMEIHDNSIGRSAKELLRKLEASIFVRENNGEVCPANWQKGDDSIKPSIELVGKL